jgi:putative flippase GtrA
MENMRRKAVGTAVAASRHSAVRYLFVGGSTFVIDVGLLILLREKFHFSLTAANTISYWTAIIYNFVLNRWWSFSAAEKNSLRRHASTYLILLIFNYLFSSVFISVVGHVMHAGIAKALAVLIQMSWTYLVYKRVIFTTTAETTPEEV